VDDRPDPLEKTTPADEEEDPNNSESSDVGVEAIRGAPLEEAHSEKQLIIDEDLVKIATQEIQNKAAAAAALAAGVADSNADDYDEEPSPSSAAAKLAHKDRIIQGAINDRGGDRDRIYHAGRDRVAHDHDSGSDLSSSDAEEVEIFKAKQKKKRRYTCHTSNYYRDRLSLSRIFVHSLTRSNTVSESCTTTPWNRLFLGELVPSRKTSKYSSTVSRS